MATDVEFFNQYFGDSDSEAEFLGFDAVELDEIDHRNVVPEFEIPNLINDDDILADIQSGWSKKISNVELLEFTVEPGVNVNLRNDAPLSDFFNLLFYGKLVFLLDCQLTSTTGSVVFQQCPCSV
jgi:hypothetical protein